MAAKSSYQFIDKTYIKEAKSNPKDRIEVIIGDDKEPDVILPQVKIQRFDNEANVSIRLKDFDNYSVVADGNKIIFGDEKKEVHFYEVTEGEGGHEIEVILREKPISNVLEFSFTDYLFCNR